MGADPARVVVVGATGLLGHVVVDVLSARGLPVVGVRGDDVLLRPAALPSAAFIINCSAWIPRDGSDTDAVRAQQKNVTLPGVLAASGVPLLHVSTDAVFGDSPSKKSERSVPDGTSLYARTKRAGEPSSAMVVRLSHVGPEVGQGRHLLARLAASAEQHGFTNHLWNGVTTLAAAQLFAEIVERRVFRPGIFHVTGESCSKAELMAALVDAFELRCRVVPTRAPVDVDRRLTSEHAIGPGLTVPSQAEQIAALVRWVRGPERSARYPALTAHPRVARTRAAPERES